MSVRPLFFILIRELVYVATIRINLSLSPLPFLFPSGKKFSFRQRKNGRKEGRSI